MGDVPKLEFGVMGKTKKAFLFFGGERRGGVEKRERGGLETNKGRARLSRGCRSFKEGCHALAAPEP